MKILVNYADEKYEPARRLNSWSGRNVAHMDCIREFHPCDIDNGFRQRYASVFSIERGNGSWLWKPYILNKVIGDAADGDIVFYIDSGAFFIKDPQPLLDFITESNPIFVTDIPLVESCWTKPDCFEAMGGKDFLYTNQIQSGIIIFKINQFTRSFFEQYLYWCCQTDLLIPAGLGKYEKVDKDYGFSFVSHREDQSILSLLCKINGIKPHRDITQRWKDEFSFYNPNYAFKPVCHPNDNYPTFLFLHKAPRFTLRWLFAFIYSRAVYLLVNRSKYVRDYKNRYHI